MPKIFIEDAQPKKWQNKALNSGLSDSKAWTTPHREGPVSERVPRKLKLTYQCRTSDQALVRILADSCIHSYLQSLCRRSHSHRSLCCIHRCLRKRKIISPSSVFVMMAHVWSFQVRVGQINKTKYKIIQASQGNCKSLHCLVPSTNINYTYYVLQMRI